MDFQEERTFPFNSTDDKRGKSFSVGHRNINIKSR